MAYISNSTIDKIFAEIDIIDVVGHYVDLKKKGNTFEACCPFHDEKTPSFTVNPSKGLYKCFGCGEGGNTFQFVQRYEKLTNAETYLKLAEILNIKVEYREDDKEFKEKREKEISALEILKVAADYYHKNLNHHSEAVAELTQRNVTTHDISKWQLGYADGSNYIATSMKELGKLNDALSLNIIKQNGNSTYDYFRNRITIPIYDVKGNTIAFGAKGLNGEKPKYINSTESDLYSKSATLFGLFQNNEAIKKQRKVYLTEGYFDVISLSRIGLNNSVATCGTALTDEQVKLLKKYTQNVILFYDGDDAGKRASWKALSILLKYGIYTSIVTKVTEGFDPDDMVRSLEKNTPFTEERNYDYYANEFKEWVEENTEDALITLSTQLYINAENAYEKGEAIAKIAETVSYIANITTKQEYIKELSTLLDINKTTFKKEIEKFETERIIQINKKYPEKASNEAGPQTEDAQEDYRKYGFWADDREAYFGYHFTTKDGRVKVSNFLLESLYLIHSNKDSKRIYKIKNDNNIERIMELPIDAMTGLSKFQANIEKLGKFIFEGTQAQVNRLKHKLYEQEKTCYEIKNLGWHKNNFWAFANGIFFDTNFLEIDKHGIVSHNDINYFIPAMSQIYSGDDASYKNDKKFLHLKKGKNKFEVWAKLYTKVYDFGEHNNGTISILFTCAAVFRDVIFQELGNSFPILFLFGPPGTGKNQLAYSILNLFGQPQDQVNLNSNTKAGLTKRMAEFSNAIIFLDEYHNALEDGTHQFLKSVSDGQSRTKSEMTSDEKTTSTPIRSSAIVAGQEKPISSGGALFSRCVYLQFQERPFNKEKYIELLDIQKKGITNILLEIINNRNIIEKEFKNTFDLANKKMHALIDAFNISRRERKQGVLKVMDRIHNSYSALLAIYYCLQNNLTFPFGKEEVEIILFDAMKRQSDMVSKSNDVSIFWEYIQSLFYSNSTNKLEEGKHFKIADKRIGDNIHQVLYLQFSSVHMLYQKEYRQSTGKPAMDKSSLQDYLKNSNEFLGVESSTRFRDDFGNSTINSSYLFDYEKLSKYINLIKIKESTNGNIANNIDEIF